ncbi:MAG: FAD-linked oxidase C-terminal domain-containing protein [Caldilineaceae bacterium]
MLAAYDTLAKAGEAVSSVVASGLLPGAMEIMDTLAIEAAEAAVSAGYPREAAGLLIVELEGERIQVDAEFEHLMRVIHASGAYEVRIANDEEERLRIWKGRKSAFSAVGRLSPDYIVQDGVVPRSRLGEALKHIQQLSQRYELRVANVFHAGDGNFASAHFVRRSSGGRSASRLKSWPAKFCTCASSWAAPSPASTAWAWKSANTCPTCSSPSTWRPCTPSAAKSTRGSWPTAAKCCRPITCPVTPAATAYAPHPLEKAGIISRE